MTCRDVIVVGAGPAGAIAALGLARTGASVLLLDRQSFPRWKVCGACVGPSALGVLETFGLRERVSDLGGVPLDRLYLHSPGRSATIPLAGNVALSRAAFDRSLVDAAVDEGVDFRNEATASIEATRSDAVALRVGSGASATVEQGRVIIDATGLGARFGRGAVAHRVASGARIGLGAVFDDPDRLVGRGDLHMAVGRHGYVGLVRVEDGTLTVGAAVDRGSLKDGPASAVDTVLEEAGLGSLGGRRLAGWTGTPPLTRRPAARACRRLFRIGDAAGYVEPFTGEGIGWALLSGAAVIPFARAATRGWTEDLSGKWERTYLRRVARHQRTCRMLSLGLRRPALVRPAITLLGRSPGMAAPLVASVGRREAS